MSFVNFLNSSPAILGEGDKKTRLTLEFGLTLDSEISFSSCVYSLEGRTAIQNIFKQYWNIAEKYNLPIMSLVPTWRADKERISKSGFAKKNVIKDNLEFFLALRKKTGSLADHICLCGVLAPKNDAYNPNAALSEIDAFEFHAEQIEQLAENGADAVSAGPLPALSEAMGIAKRMSKIDVPGMLSFLLRPSGTLLDGTPLHEAIAKIDNTIARPPAYYMVNCLHPSILIEALMSEAKYLNIIKGRLIGIYGNGSKKRLEELDNKKIIETDDIEEFAAASVSLHKDYGLKILGGCCGTNDKHIEAIAKGLRKIYIART